MDAEKIRRIIRAYLLSIGLWSALSLLTGWQYRIFDQDWNVPSSLVDMVLLAETRGFAFALLTPPIFFLVRRSNTEAGRSFRYLPAYVFGLVPFMVLYAVIRWIVVKPWSAQLQRYVPRAGQSPLGLIRSGFADQITMYIAIIAAAHAYVYFERVRKQELERYEFERALAASELQALKMQLHPHFLFNTLHGISTLIDSDHDCAKTMIVKLSSLLRIALQQSGSDLVSLQEELKFIREYLDLEKMRFGPRLKITWSIAPDTQSILVPQLILQPLVENAIRHGIASSRESGWVEISSQRIGEAIELRVRNSIGVSRPHGTGVGLPNTEARLKHLFGGEAALSLTMGDDQTAAASVIFPALGLRPSASEIGNDHASADHR